MQNLEPASGPGLLTWSGRFIPSEKNDADDRDAPSMIDIAVALSRIPRFAGHTPGYWTVLDHSLFVRMLAKQDSDNRQLQLAALLHDAHEALTADIPTHFKTSDMRYQQSRMDRLIMEAHFPGGWLAFKDHEEAVKDLDQRALLAEARIVGPAPTDQKMAYYFGAQPDPDDAAVLRRILMLQPTPDVVNPMQCKRVINFLALVHELR